MSLWEVLLIVLIAFLVFTPKQLPQLAKHLGQLYSRCQSLFSNVRQSVDHELKQKTLEENTARAKAAEDDD